jgi:hypothetical protein
MLPTKSPRFSGMADLMEDASNTGLSMIYIYMDMISPYIEVSLKMGNHLQILNSVMIVLKLPRNLPILDYSAAHIKPIMVLGSNT